jgi:polysaccharide export outer membrane protein
MTILDAVVEAGSVTAAAGSLIQLVRPRRDDGGDTGNSHAEIVTVDFAELRGGQSAGNHLLRDGDTVVVLPARPIFVTGHVRSPGAYAAQPGMTVLQAVSLAGGFAERGSNRRLKILRVVDGHKKEIDVKLTDVVEAGDTIIVPKRFF